jgi:hypothetical protein
MREDIIRRAIRKQEKEILTLHQNIYSVKIFWVETEENEGICVNIKYYNSKSELSKRNIRAKNFSELKTKIINILKNNGL